MAGMFERKLTELGISLPKPASPVANYVPFVRIGTLDFVIDRGAASSAGRSRAGPAGGLESPMPGGVTRVMVTAGEIVKKGQPLLAIEAMKMEHLIRSPRDGKVRELHAKAGEMVSPGVALAELEEE